MGFGGLKLVSSHREGLTEGNLVFGGEGKVGGDAVRLTLALLIGKGDCVSRDRDMKRKCV